MFKVGDKVRLKYGCKAIGVLLGKANRYWLVQLPLNCPDGIKTGAFSVKNIEKDYNCKILHDYSYRGASDEDMEFVAWDKRTISYQLVQMYSE